MSDAKTGPAEKMYDVLHHRQYVKTMYADAALAEKEARIAELEAENERLKCCGNCTYENEVWGACDDDVDEELPDSGAVEPSDSCHFTPSRWTERSTS